MRVRRALSNAKDKKAFIDGVYKGMAKPIGSHMAPTDTGYVGLTDQYAFDVGKAKALLKKAGVQMHLNPSNVPENPQNWKRWRSWSYTACIPFSLEDLDKWDPIPIRYTEYYNLPELDYNPCSYDGSKFKTMYCRPFERMSFASSHIAHEVLPANNRCFWILHDLTFEDGVLPHTNIRSDVVENLADMQKDILEIISTKKEDGTLYFKRQFMSDLDYFLSFNKPVNDFDWMPSNL